MPTKTKDLAVIGKALNEISWEWLNDNRPALAEALTIAVERGATATEIRRCAIDQDMRSMRQDGWLKVIEGTTSIEEVLRVVI